MRVHLKSRRFDSADSVHYVVVVVVTAAQESIRETINFDDRSIDVNVWITVVDVIRGRQQR